MYVCMYTLLQSPNIPKHVWEIGDAHSSPFLHIANDLPGVCLPRVSLEFPTLLLPSQTDTVIILMESIQTLRKIDLSLPPIRYTIIFRDLELEGHIYNGVALTICCELTFKTGYARIIKSRK